MLLPLRRLPSCAWSRLCSRSPLSVTGGTSHQRHAHANGAANNTENALRNVWHVLVLRDIQLRPPKRRRVSASQRGIQAAVSCAMPVLGTAGSGQSPPLQSLPSSIWRNRRTGPLVGWRYPTNEVRSRRCAAQSPIFSLGRSITGFQGKRSNPGDVSEGISQDRRSVLRLAWRMSLSMASVAGGTRRVGG